MFRFLKPSMRRAVGSKSDCALRNTILISSMRKARVPNEIQEPESRTEENSHGVLPPLLRIAVKRRKLVLAATIAIVVLGLAAALLLPGRYTATEVILPPQQGGSIGAGMLAQLGNLGAMASAAGGLGIKNPNDQQVALLKSRTVEDAMVERFHLQTLYRSKYLSTACKRWEQATKIDSGMKDGLIRLSVTDQDPRRAADLAGGWVEEYRHLTASLAISEASRRRLFFEQQLNSARADLTHAEENLKQTEQRTGVIEMDGQARAMIESAAVVRAQIADKQVEIRAMREFAAQQNPDLVRAQQELTSMEGQLAALDVDNGHRQGDLVAPKGQVTQNGLDYARALRDMKYNETIYELLLRQYEVARVDEARQGSLVQVVDAAAVPDKPDSLYKIWIALAALVVALPLALLVAVCAELVQILRRNLRRTGSWVAVLEEAVTGAAL